MNKGKKNGGKALEQFTREVQRKKLWPNQNVLLHSLQLSNKWHLHPRTSDVTKTLKMYNLKQA